MGLCCPRQPISATVIAGRHQFVLSSLNCSVPSRVPAIGCRVVGVTAQAATDKDKNDANNASRTSFFIAVSFLKGARSAGGRPSLSFLLLVRFHQPVGAVIDLQHTIGEPEV